MVVASALWTPLVEPENPRAQRLLERSSARELVPAGWRPQTWPNLALRAVCTLHIHLQAVPATEKQL